MHTGPAEPNPISRLHMRMCLGARLTSRTFPTVSRYIARTDVARHLRASAALNRVASASVEAPLTFESFQATEGCIIPSTINISLTCYVVHCSIAQYLTGILFLTNGTIIVIIFLFADY